MLVCIILLGLGFAAPIEDLVVVGSIPMLPAYEHNWYSGYLEA